MVFLRFSLGLSAFPWLFLCFLVPFFYFSSLVFPVVFFSCSHMLPATSALFFSLPWSTLGRRDCAVACEAGCRGGPAPLPTPWDLGSAGHRWVWTGQEEGGKTHRAGGQRGRGKGQFLAAEKGGFRVIFYILGWGKSEFSSSLMGKSTSGKMY